MQRRLEEKNVRQIDQTPEMMKTSSKESFISHPMSEYLTSSYLNLSLDT